MFKKYLNSTLALSQASSSGSIVESYVYDAYGNVTIRNGSGTVIPASAYGNRYLFQGREYDYTTQLYHFRARWYDPETGRWLSNDPIGISGGLNLYAFCSNAPVNFVDPMGLEVLVLLEGKNRSTISLAHEYVVGRNEDGTYWSSDMNWHDTDTCGSFGSSGNEFDPRALIWKSKKNFNPDFDFDTNKYTIVRCITTSPEVDVVVKNEAIRRSKSVLLSFPIYSAAFSSCRKYANSLADYAEDKMDGRSVEQKAVDAFTRHLRYKPDN